MSRRIGVAERTARVVYLTWAGAMALAAAGVTLFTLALVTGWAIEAWLWH